MKLRKASALAASVLALSLTATACGSSDDDNGGSGDGGGGKITVGIKFDQPGLGLKTPDGSFAGFDVDVATYVAGELGYTPENINFVESPSPERENLLKRGDVDFIVATYSITDTRKQEVDFAGPYFVAHQDLLIRADEDVTSEDDINNLTLCSVAGSTPAQRIKDEIAPEAGLFEQATYSECLAGLENGQVDAITTDDVILAGYAAQDQHQGKFKLAGLNLSDEFYGIGVQKGSDLRADINTAIQKMIDDGEWDAAIEKNVGPSGYAAEGAPEITETN
ncbi:glutamate ABC transporter substrate-binding protein [Streptomyces sp. JH002]|uniref:glutamate ABC transporter substrate-binding protein n=1 Tax=Streptomyces TaxID=1883 RepID=UPI0036AF1180